MEYWMYQQRLGLPLEIKELMTIQRIRHFYEQNKSDVYVSFSGGKDSTVLLHLSRRYNKSIPGIFVNTGLEFPEIVRFTKTLENIITIRPKKTFKQVIQEYGYPVISKEIAQKIYEVRTTNSEKLWDKRVYGQDGNGKIPDKWFHMVDAPFKISHQCCYELKKKPLHKITIGSITGMMAEESRLRKTSYLKNGCFIQNKNQLNPISFWTEQDVWDYIHKYDILYSPIYDMGYSRTGCTFCMFGIHLEKTPNKFQRMKETHPKLWNYCINKLELNKVLDYIHVPYQ